MTLDLTIHYTYGLPGSGKTTFARDFIKRSSRPITRVNRDDLRWMLFGSYWGKGVNENIVTQVQHGIIKDSLARGHDVFSDDTNLSPQALGGLTARAVEHGANLVEHDFSDVPPWTCIENDLKRDRQVGAKVIWDMWERYLKPEHPGNPDLPHAILVDVDGTIAIHGNRGPFEWHRVGEDAVNHMVVKIVRLLAADHKILIVSGRDAVCRPETEKWLVDNNIPYDAIYMRPEGDTRSDYIVKNELLNDILASYYPVLTIDDRRQVIERCWRYRGIECWEVARGDF